MVVGAPGGENGGSWRANIVRIYTPPNPDQRLVQMYFPIAIVDILILWGVRVPPTATPKK